MADFLSNLVGQVQGAAPAVVPLLPPHFAPWHGLPRTGAALFSREPVSAPERGAQSPMFQPPLIGPDDPAIDAPLHAFRQMSRLMPVPELSSQPDQEPVAQDPPETADFEPGDIRQTVLKVVPPTAKVTPPGAPQTASTPDPLLPASSPAPPIQTREDRDHDSAVVASPASLGEADNWLVPEAASMEADQEFQPSLGSEPKSTLQSSPQPVAGRDSSKAFAGTSGPPNKRGESFQHPRAEPVEAQPERVEFQPEPVEARPMPVARSSEPNKNQLNPVERRFAPVAWQPAPVRGRTEFVKRHTEPVDVQPELVEARRTEISIPSPTGAPAPPPQTVQPSAPTLGKVIESITLLVPPPVTDTEPDQPVSIQTSESATPIASTLSAGSVEPDLPVGRAVPGRSEPMIVPAPEYVPGEMGSTIGEEGTQSQRLPSGRSSIDQPESIPTVRVTIGRVVVRASPAAECPPSPRVELPRPPLSLEEYLRGRQGGGR